MKKWFVGVAGLLMILSCGSKRLSPEVLQHKLDSIKAVEIKERLALQGIDLTKSDNTLKLFYDSLNLQPLPLSYSEDYVRFLPDFKDVPSEIVSLLEFDGEHPKAITLPESVGTRLLVVASAGSRNPEHIRDNLDILDFTLTEAEMAEIAKLDRGERYYHRSDAQLAQFAAWQPDFEKN